MSVEQEDNMLICPKCGSRDLHQLRVATYTPNSEDAKEGLQATVDNSTCDPFNEGPNHIFINHDMTYYHEKAEVHNMRRQMMFIEFVCEHGCIHHDPSSPNRHTPLRLFIWQHKGGTIMEWNV